MSQEFIATKALHDWFLAVNIEKGKWSPLPAPWDPPPKPEMTEQELKDHIAALDAKFKAHYAANENSTENGA